MRGFVLSLKAKRSFWVLILLMVAALILQLHNNSKYNVYPDSYQSLAVAKNLKNSHKLVASMGQGGILYPDFFGWTRPFYPLLIAGLSSFGLSLETSAHVIATTAAVLAIPVVFLMVAAIFKSYKPALIAATLLTFSYNHVSWGGFVLTETLGVLMLSLALWSLAANRKVKNEWLETADIITGLLFVLAILTRYEYIALLLPAAFLAGKKWSPKRSGTILIVSLLGSFAVLVALQAFGGGLSWTWQQLHSFVAVMIFEVLAIGIVFVIATSGRVKEFQNWASDITNLLIVLATAALIIHHNLYLGLWRFAVHDPLVAVLSIIGLIALLLGDSAKQRLGLGLTTGLVILGVSYYHTNPLMDRYGTHLLPLLLIAASYGAWQILKIKKYQPAVITVLVICLGLQSFNTWQGLHGADNNIWFKPSYETLTTQKIAPLLSSNDLVIAALPEPYYIYSSASVQSVTNFAPYVYLSGLPANQTVFVMDDLPMQQLFPAASKQFEQKLAPYKVAQGTANVPFRYISQITQTSKPLMVYKLKVNQLQCLVAKGNNTEGECK